MLALRWLKLTREKFIHSLGSRCNFPNIENSEEQSMQRPRISTLQHRLLANVVLSVLMLGLCIYFGLKLKEKAAEEIYRESLNTARLLLSHFEEEVRSIDSRLEKISLYLEGADLDDINIVDREKHWHEFLEYLSGPASISGPGVFDRRGLLIASGELYPVPKLSFADNPAFRVHADKPNESKLYISKSVIGKITKQWSIHFTRPLRTKSGDFAGVVLIAYKLSNFSNLYEKLNLTVHGLVALNGFDGLSRMRIANGIIEYEFVPRLRQLAFSRVVAGEAEGRFHGVGAIDGTVRIGSFVASKDYPFYVLVAYDNEYFRKQYAGSFVILAISWMFISAAMFGTMLISHRFYKARQQSQIDIAVASERGAAAERQNILADMHDNIGASLTTLLSSLSTAVPSVGDIKRRIAEILIELRFLAETSEPVDGDLATTMASVRHRMAATIEQAGVTLEWPVVNLPKIASFTARDALNLKLILLEALSNALNHAKAKNIAVLSSHDTQTGMTTISVSDDGIGFDPAIARNSSRGLRNMRSRADAMSTGAKLTINSASGKGTTVRIELRVPPQLKSNP